MLRGALRARPGITGEGLCMMISHAHDPEKLQSSVTQLRHETAIVVALDS